MVCCSCQSAGTQLEAVYKRQMTGAGMSYQERQQVLVQRSECGGEVVLVLLEVHLQTQHRKAGGGRQNWGTIPPGREPCTYKMTFPTSGAPRNCPVEGCQGQAATRTVMQVHLSTGMYGTL